MAATAKIIEELCEQTGTEVMDCKRALTEASGDIGKAIDLLREKGLTSAAKKARRITPEGLVDPYIHGGHIGVLIEINSETDFVAEDEEFESFVKDVVVQVAAVNLRYVSREEVPAELIRHEREVLTEQARHEDKPEKTIERMVEGRLEKYYEETYLSDQYFIKDGNLEIQNALNNLIFKIGRSIKIHRLARFGVGEGLEKKEEDSTEEVAKQMGTNE